MGGLGGVPVRGASRGPTTRPAHLLHLDVKVLPGGHGRLLFLRVSHASLPMPSASLSLSLLFEGCFELQKNEASLRADLGGNPVLSDLSKKSRGRQAGCSEKKAKLVEVG